MTYRYLPAARLELHEAVRYYKQQRAGLEKEFTGQVRAAIERVRAMPETWPLIGRRIRRHLVKRFPYAIIYQAHPHEVLIVAVAHLHRNPGYWVDRVAGDDE